MPELPEVETTKRGITPWLMNRHISRFTVRNGHLRWAVPEHLSQTLIGQQIIDIRRRSKYILIHVEKGHLLIHLGMSGSLRICHPSDPLKTHDHLIWHFASDNNLAPIELRYHDPRRFGCCLWTTEAPESHHLIKNLGPEPLEATFDDDFLFKASRHKVTAIKRLLMDNHVVVGIGNIYANEALFQASIHPLAPANSLSQQQYQALSIAIRETLSRAINQGGSTLRDFVNSDGKPGYFQQTLKVYGRGGQPCTRCARRLTEIRINGRSTVFCTQCQQ